MGFRSDPGSREVSFSAILRTVSSAHMTREAVDVPLHCATTVILIRSSNGEAQGVTTPETLASPCLQKMHTRRHTSRHVVHATRQVGVIDSILASVRRYHGEDNVVDRASQACFPVLLHRRWELANKQSLWLSFAAVSVGLRVGPHAYHP